MGKEEKQSKNNSPAHHEQPGKKDREVASEDTIILSLPEYEALKKEAEKAAENWDKYLRLYSEFENSRKMWERQKQELLKFGNFRILKECIGILDELEAALQSLRGVDDHHAHGLEMIYNKMKEMVKNEGVSEIKSLGEIFDPHVHEAIMIEENPEAPENSISNVIQRGYLYEDKVLRSAKVKISRKPKSKEPVSTENKKEESLQSNQEKQGG